MRMNLEAWSRLCTAGIYLLKGDAEAKYRDFHLGEKPLCDIIGPFGFRPEDREPVMPDHLDPQSHLSWSFLSEKKKRGKQASRRVFIAQQLILTVPCENAGPAWP